MNIHYQLSTLKKRDSSIANYFHKFTGLVDTLAAIDQPLKQEEQISFLLASLGSEYESFVTTVQMRTDLISIESLYGHLLSHELHLAQSQPKVDLNLAGAHFASHGGSSRGGHGGRFSNHSQSGVPLLDNATTVAVVHPTIVLVPLAKSVASLDMWHSHVINAMITHTPVIPICKLSMQTLNLPLMIRSEERRVGKECQ